MKIIHVVVAYGGSYEDAWDHNLCAVQTHVEAAELCDKYSTWLDTIRSTPVPAHLEPVTEEMTENWEDAQWEAYWNTHEADELVWRHNLLDELQVPEVHRKFLLENWDHSYDCDRPSYRIEELKLL